MSRDVNFKGSIVWDSSAPGQEDDELLDPSVVKVEVAVVTEEDVLDATLKALVVTAKGGFTFSIDLDDVVIGKGVRAFHLQLPPSIQLKDGTPRFLGTNHALEVQDEPDDKITVPPIFYEGGRIDVSVGARFIDPTDLYPDEPMSGVTFWLFRGAASGGQFYRKAISDRTGVAVFSDLEPNLYMVRAVAQTHEGRAVEPDNPTDGCRFIAVASGQPAEVLEFTFRPVSSVVTGSVVDDRGNSVDGVKLFLARTNLRGPSRDATTNSSGVFTFEDVEPGHYVVSIGEKIIRANPPVWEPDPASGTSRSVHVPTSGSSTTVSPFVIRPEVHRIFGRVRTATGGPADGAVISFTTDDGSTPLGSVVTNSDGSYEWFPPYAGTFRVRAELSPTGRLLQVRRATVNSETEVNIDESPDGGSAAPNVVMQSNGVSDGAIASGLADLTSYPQLGIGGGFVHAPNSSTGNGGASAVQRVENAIRDVLGWRPKEGDTKGYLAALTQAFTPVEIGGNTTWKWTPRSYHVQADMGKITGAQASIYARAQAALDQSNPLLDGLQPLDPASDEENLEAVRAVVRSNFSELVHELGEEGGPRVARVDALFTSLLGPEDAAAAIVDPAAVDGQLGGLQDRFGLDRRRVNTVDEEQNLTNFLIIVDHVRSLRQSWLANRAFFVGGSETEPFFGTQLVLVSRALAVVAESVGEVFFVMDSVFLRAAERQTTQLTYADAPPIFLESLLTWVERAAADELPSLIQEGGKLGARAAVPTLQSLTGLVRGALLAEGQHSPSLSAGYKTARVQRAMGELAAHLQTAANLADQLSEPNAPPPEAPPNEAPAISVAEIVEALREELRATETPASVAGDGHNGSSSRSNGRRLRS